MNFFRRNRMAISTIAIVALFFGQNATAGDNTLGSECNAPQYVEKPQNNKWMPPTSGSIFANVPSVTLYTSTFLDAVYSSDILRDAFDLSQTPAQQYADFKTTHAKKYFQSIGIDNADGLVEFMLRGIGDFQVLTLPIVARVHANAAANFLFTDGFLQLYNAEYLASKYARAMVDSAKINLNSDPSSKFKVFVDGVINYFASLGMTTKEKIPLIAYYAGNEWLVAATNYR